MKPASYLLILSLLSILIITTGCNKEPVVDEKYTKKMDDLNIPPDFIWRTAIDVPVTVSVDFSGGIPEQYVKISIYNNHPDKNGALLSQGTVGSQFAYNSVLNLPTDLDSVYVKLTSPDGSEQVQQVAVNSQIQVSMTAGAPIQNYPDQDSDQVPDLYDEFPSDPSKAFHSYFPNSLEYGSIMFEDNWPSKGDYDFNDLVIDYQTTLVTNNRNLVCEIQTQYRVRAAGAALKNGFGFQLDNVSANLVTDLTGISVLNSFITLSPNGTEHNQPRAVIIVLDVVDNVIHKYPSSGDFFNTWPGVPKGTSDPVTVKFGLTIPQSILDVGTPPFNPFLIKDKSRGYEIHMAGYIPTQLADSTLFGTADDNSIPSKGIYYKSNIYLPWGLYTPSTYDYTYETVQILEGYRYFDAWAQSNGTKYRDWYRNVPGYRDESKIYQ